MSSVQTTTTDSTKYRVPASTEQPTLRRTGRFERVLRTKLQAHLSALPGTLALNDSDGLHLCGAQGESGLSARIDVYDPGFYRRLAAAGSLGAAESWMHGEWTTPDLVTLLRMFAGNIDTLRAAEGRAAGAYKWLARIAGRLQRNTRAGSRRNIEAHYDLGNEFFELFLDPTMMYSSACFDRPDSTLQEASESKLERICRRLQLDSGDHVVEIGTGWGGFAEYAVRNYGCRVTTTTISPRQYQYASERIQKAGLADRVTLLQSDYRDLNGTYDKLVSIEMIEAVGHEFLGTYFGKCSDLLKPGGRMVIQSIVMPEQRFEQYRRSVDFIQKYIFPGGFLPSVEAIQTAVGQRTELQLTSLQDYVPSYARTLREWRARFLDRLDDVRRMGFSETFIRMWDYYFSYCEAAFLERAVGLVQMEWVKVAAR